MNNILKFWPCNVSGILANGNKAPEYKDMFTDIYYNIAFIDK